MVKISASILSANFAELGKEIKSATESGVDAIHVDIIDGHFAPNISFGVNAVKISRQFSAAAVEAHLMVEGEVFLMHCLVPEVAAAGADVIIVHAEAVMHLDGVLALIRRLGKKAGVSINPGTSLEALRCVMPKLDQILIMTVNPGFSGQEFIPGMLEKIKACRHMVNELGGNVEIAVDGGVNQHNAFAIRKAGANILVAGNGIFSQNTVGELGYVEAVSRLRNASE